MIKALLKLADRLDQNGLHDSASSVDQIILSLAQDIQGRISVSDLMKVKPSIAEALKEAITFDLIIEPDSEGRGNSVKAIPKIHDKWTDGLNLGDLSSTPGLESYLTNEPLGETVKQVEKGEWFDEDTSIPFANKEDVEFTPEHLKDEEQKQQKKEIDDALSGAFETWEKEQDNKEKWFEPSDFESSEPKVALNKTQERMGMHKTESEIRGLLVKMADNFDQAGQHDLALDIDHTLKSLSARPKAPLKKLDDDIKKSLIIFVHDADRNNNKSIKGLRELFRRLRYFDFADASKDLGLDKVVKEMEKTQDCLDGAKKRFYELMHGRKPSKKDLEDLFTDLAEELEEQPALDFFDEQLKKEDDIDIDEDELEENDNDEEEKLIDEDELEENDDSEEEELTDEMEKELEEFLASLEDDMEDE